MPKAVTVQVIYWITTEIYASDIRAEYDAFRETFLNRSRDKNFLTIEQARKINCN
jgi:hypothetical protein